MKKSSFNSPSESFVSEMAGKSKRNARLLADFLNRFRFFSPPVPLSSEFRTRGTQKKAKHRGKSKTAFYFFAIRLFAHLLFSAVPVLLSYTQRSSYLSSSS